MKQAIVYALASALLTVGIIKAAPATAAEPAANPVKVSLVRTVDLDLRTVAGRQALDRRLAQAAREVCGSAPDYDISGKNDVRRCRRETLARAREQGARAIAADSAGETIAVAGTR